MPQRIWIEPELIQMQFVESPFSYNYRNYVIEFDDNKTNKQLMWKLETFPWEYEININNMNAYSGDNVNYCPFWLGSVVNIENNSSVIVFLICKCYKKHNNCVPIICGPECKPKKNATSIYLLWISYYEICLSIMKYQMMM